MSSQPAVSSQPQAIPPFKAAAVELNPHFGHFEANLPLIAAATEDAARNGARLIVLPEMVTTGYIYQDRAQINPYLDTIPGRTTATIEPIARQYRAYVAVGIAEVDPVTNVGYNAAALIGPDGYIGKYRKNGLNSTDTRWATRGNLGFPVFDTELGRIALVICYDDAYLQSLLLPALRGADIMAYLTSSDRLLPGEPGAEFNHSTIANIASVPGWIGMYIVGSTRTDTEVNPATGLRTHYDGGASIWDPNGNNLAQAPTSPVDNPALPVTIYAEIDPALYDNPAKQALRTRRRPELYQDVTLYRAPIDPNAASTSHQINAVALQFTPVDGDRAANLATVRRLLQQASQESAFNLVVLPEYSLIGHQQPGQLRQAAESTTGNTVQSLAELARTYRTFLAFSMPERDGDQYYASAVLLDDEGRIAGVYRKAHLNETERSWASAGDSIPVFETRLGRIGFVLGDEARLPDMAEVLGVKRADLILIPTSWSGEYGGPVLVDPGLLIEPFPANTMYMWYDIAKYAQAYTIVANYVGGPQGYKGSSGLYTLDPIQAHYVPRLAPVDQEAAFQTSFATLGLPTWWMTQDYLTVGRRVELNPPLVLDPQSSCFLDWQRDGTGNSFCWNR